MVIDIKSHTLTTPPNPHCMSLPLAQSTVEYMENLSNAYNFEHVEDATADAENLDYHPESESSTVGDDDRHMEEDSYDEDADYFHLDFSDHGANSDPYNDSELEFEDPQPLGIPGADMNMDSYLDGFEEDEFDASELIILAAYDPIENTWPTIDAEYVFARDAMSFIGENLTSPEDWDTLVDGLLEQYADNDSYYRRTLNWFNSLCLAFQMEIIIQRYIGLRPNTKWIIGPFDLLEESWARRWETEMCIRIETEYHGDNFSIDELPRPVPEFLERSRRRREGRTWSDSWNTRIDNELVL